MNSTKIEQSTSSAIISENNEDLKKIHLSDKIIAICQRDITSLKYEINQLLQHQLIFEETGKIQELIKKLDFYLKTFNISKSLIAEDIAGCLFHFKNITQGTTFRLSLKTISNDMCTKYHSDFNTLRMLCTYAGPSTLYLLPSGDKGINQAHENYSKNEAGTGNMVILKGEKYPDSAQVFHRSPAIKKDKLTRILLKIDVH